jgi:hypothetical protein
MSLGFTVAKVLHRINACFVKAFLPGLKGKFHLKTVHQQTLNVHEVASKADIYKIHSSPETIEEGANAFFALVCHLAAEGYKIETPVFKLSARIPGVYNGTETKLPAGVHPEVRLSAGKELKDYVKANSEVVFVGKLTNSAAIDQVYDHGSETADECLTRGRNITITGNGLKIMASPEHKADTGVFFERSDGSLIPAHQPPANEPKRLVVLVPQDLEEGAEYRICIKTMPGPSHGIPGGEVCVIRSDKAYRVAA